jgi:tetratricopeptide (TPR) repeat protein
MEIKCGAPLHPPKPEPKGLAKIRGGFHSAPKLPEACVLARFKDAAFPLIDLNAPSAPIGLYGPGGLFNGTGPVEAKWATTIREFQAVADEIADYGPRPTVRAEVRLNQLDLAESHAVFEGPPGHGGVIVLSTRLVEALRELSEHQASDGSGKSDEIAQQYLKFIIAHEYAHLVLNHPQQLAKSENLYHELGQALQMAGVIYAVVNGVSTNKNTSYLAQQAKARQSMGVLLGATFAGEIVATEGTRFIFPVFNRSVERDADMLAVDILRRTANADPITGVGGLKVFYHENEASIRRNAELSANAKRTAGLAAITVLAAAPALVQGDSKTAAKQLKTGAVVIAVDYAARKLEEHRMMVDAHLHDSPDARDVLVNAYADAFYDDEGPVTRPVANFDAVLPPPTPTAAPPAAARPRIHDVNFKKIGAEVDAYAASENAKEALAKGDIAKARKAIDVALRSPIKDDAQIQLIAGGVANAENKPDEAIRHFRAAVAAGDNAPDVWNEIIQTLRAKDDLAGALKAIDEAGSKTHDPRAFIVLKMDIHGEQQDDKAVAADLADCRAFKNSGLTLRCEQTNARIRADAAAAEKVPGRDAKSVAGKPLKPSD